MSYHTSTAEVRKLLDAYLPEWDEHQVREQMKLYRGAREQFLDQAARLIENSIK